MTKVSTMYKRSWTKRRVFIARRVEADKSESRCEFLGEDKGKGSEEEGEWVTSIYMGHQ